MAPPTNTFPMGGNSSSQLNSDCVAPLPNLSITMKQLKTRTDSVYLDI